MGKLKNLKMPERPKILLCGLTEKEMLFLDLNFFGVIESWRLYKHIVDPNVTDYKAKQSCSSLFNDIDAVSYLEQRSRQIEIHLWPEEATDEDFSLPPNADKIVILEAWKKLKNGNFGNSEEWTLFLKKALASIENNVDIEPPRRYLAETCGECRYRAYCEENLEDECPACKYREYALKKGCEEFNYTNQLNKHEIHRENN